MGEHTRIEAYSTGGAVRRHNALPGHVLDINNPTEVFLSDCYSTRVTVEAALIHAAPTSIQGNTASASVDSNNLVAPIICRSTKFNWNNLRACIPQLKKDAIPYPRRSRFGNTEIIRAPPDLHTQPLAPRVTRSGRTRQATWICGHPITLPLGHNPENFKSRHSLLNHCDGRKELSTAEPTVVGWNMYGLKGDNFVQ